MGADRVNVTGQFDGEGRTEYLYQLDGFYMHFYISAVVEVRKGFASVPMLLLR